MMYKLNYLDEVQSHILGVITTLMINYNLNPGQVTARYEYLTSGVPQTQAIVSATAASDDTADSNQQPESVNVEYEAMSVDSVENIDTNEVLYSYTTASSALPTDKQPPRGDNQEESSEDTLSEPMDEGSEFDEFDEVDEDKAPRPEDPAAVDELEAKIRRWGDYELKDAKNAALRKDQA